MTAPGMATQRAQRAFLAHSKAKQAGLILPAAQPADAPANQNCTNELRHPSQRRLAPGPLGQLRAPNADLPAAGPIGEPPHPASRLRATPSRILPCPAANG